MKADSVDEGLLLIAALTAILTGCQWTTAYKPPKLASSDEMAVLQVGIPDVSREVLPGDIQLDVYDYSVGCPDVSFRMSGRGYRGSPPLVGGQIRELMLAGDQPVLLTAEAKTASGTCSQSLVFRPRRGATYLYRFIPPEGGDESCGVALREVIAENADGVVTVPVHNIRWLETYKSYWWGRATDADLCALATVRSDEPAHETGAGVATPIVARPEYPPAQNRRISGNALGLRFGFSGGGDTLARTQASDGSERAVSGGGGGMVAADLKLTPLWLRDTVGFGLGAELGGKFQHISASDGSASLRRYPLIVEAHVFLRVDDYAYVTLAGGVERDLGVAFSASGAFAEDVHVRSALGGAGSLGFSYALTPHLVLDADVRFAIMHYDLAASVGDAQRVSASYFGFTTGGKFFF